MVKLQPPRGTADLMPEAMHSHRQVIDTARGIADIYGFAEMATPIFEFTEVFSRPLGASSDVVTKETYSFTDRGGESLTLRPEGTAGVVRALISEGLTQTLPQKFFYSGPMFRYERPQKGRMRQFHQIGAEFLGAKGAEADAEIIALGAAVLRNLDVLSSCRLHLNSLGDTESRQRYRQVLVDYLFDLRHKLSADSIKRLETNPLRILDSKDEGDQILLAEAPRLSGCLNEASSDYFAQVQNLLNAINLPFILDEKLVRGLDYYCHTAFEFITDDIGAQGTVLGGGRYDGLAASLGGADIAGVGWAAGVERLVLLRDEEHQPRAPVVLLVMPPHEAVIFALSEALRAAEIKTEIRIGTNLGKLMKKADKLGASYVGIYGTDEAAKKSLILRHMQDGTQSEIALDKVVEQMRIIDKGQI